MTFGRCLCIWSAIMAIAITAQARQVDVPMRFDFDFIRQALVAQVYTGPDEQARLWDDGSGCGFLHLHQPAIGAAGGRLRVVTAGEARVGMSLMGLCLAPVHWQGFLEIFEEPQITAEHDALRFRVVESNIYNSQWQKGLFTGKIWDLVKRYVQPSFEAVRIDLKPAVDDVRSFLPLVMGHGDQARIAALLASLHLTGAVLTESGVQVTLAFAVSHVVPPTAPTPEPTLTPEEVERWDQAWQRWDAFLTFVVKQFGHDAATQELRQALFDVLMDGRYDILDALVPPAPGAPDPTRDLFLKTWERLAPVARRTAVALPGTNALRYLSFIAAGDALAALGQAGPAIGLEISADGLRRLARMVAPLSTEDPLAYGVTVDPALRLEFGFGALLPPPDLSAEPSDASAQASWWHVFVPRVAHAAVEQPPAAKALGQWLPPDADSVDTYLQGVHEVLADATHVLLARNALQSQYHDLYRRLVLATAWQETCWRQFVHVGGKVTYLKSAVGSIGIMQINEHVWRGFYDVRGLRWDIRYNARAGGEILLHYLRDYALDHQRAGVPDYLARATYAVYNGGPGHLKRILKKDRSKNLKRIDDLFWEKFKAVTAGNQDGIARCLVGG